MRQWEESVHIMRAFRAGPALDDDDADDGVHEEDDA
jgi:hypothetical protein